jgi:hypothetical protein
MSNTNTLDERFAKMTYSNSDIKRQDRLLDEHSACNLLKTGEYGVLSLTCPEAGVYSVPTN